jgi:Cof subfamily protein (haloacid dehalogenase superfamily)
MVTPMTPKLIALDLDETTLNPQSRLSPGNRAALEAAIAAGIEIVIASGRSLDTLPEEMTHFPGIRYAICGNGSMVYDLTAHTVLVQHFLPPETAGQVLRLTQGAFLTYEAFVDGCAYAQSDYVNLPTNYLCGENSAAYIQATRRPVPDIAAFLLNHETRLDSLDIVVGNLQVKETMMQRLKTLSGIYITSSVPHLIEISNEACGKHRGLAFLAEHLGIPQSAVCAFGNADNDADMLAWAGLGIAVANGSPTCRAAADVITSDYLEDGVAQAFEAHLQIHPISKGEPYGTAH